LNYKERKYLLKKETHPICTNGSCLILLAIIVNVNDNIIMTGTLFDIKEFAVHDGPGIRTTIFLKGCPLRCAWCHNPEGLSFEPETLHTATGERQCGEVVDVSHLAERLRRSSFLYGEDGGVTFSGGEPLAQPEFVLEMIAALKPIHLAVQTSGHAPAAVFQSIVEAVDLVMLDIKHSDPEIHKRFTGVDNSLYGRIFAFW
jgi:pyruvate formate lyase activating enzyme